MGLISWHHIVYLEFGNLDWIQEECIILRGNILRQTATRIFIFPLLKLVSEFKYWPWHFLCAPALNVTVSNCLHWEANPVKK